MSKFTEYELNTIEKSWKYYNKNSKIDKNDIKVIRVCLYLRKSTEDFKDNSLKLQQNEIDKFIKLINELYRDSYLFYYDKEDVFAEDNVSGMQGRLRPEFDRMLSFIEYNPGYYGICIVYKMDRFSRKLEDTLKYITLLKSFKCVLKALDFSDNGDPTSDLLRNILGVVAQYHAQNSAYTSIKGTMKKVEENKAVGLLPLGLIQEKVLLGDFNSKGASNIVIDPNKSIIIEEIFNKYASGMSLADIEKYLKNCEYTNNEGHYLSKQQICYILSNKKYNGIYVYADPDKKRNRKYDNGVSKPSYYEMKNAFPKIIDDNLFNKVQLMLNCKSGIHERSFSETEYLLSNVLICGVCNKKLNGWSRPKYNGKRYFDYVCVTHKNNANICSTKRINKIYLEEVVKKIVLNILNKLLLNLKVNYKDIFYGKIQNLKQINSCISCEISQTEYKLNKLLERTILNNKFDIYENQINELENKISVLKNKLTINENKLQTMINKISEKLNSIDLSDLKITKLMVNLIIDKIIVSNDIITIEFKLK